ncbi:hypothetical protein Dsi01nite_100860 [Dactylosporangium siamense]|uniref:Zinc ribbon domain-containing protein n=2 Tax=Dactylosporangium siamense TaxID=685454 RepID=A0A919UHY9_9ACTN|nr:hypothetical protein Dsi01nite_100860 [Dactylosporangium siamense]
MSWLGVALYRVRMRCPRCGATGVDAQGLCLRCGLRIGAPPPVQRNPLLIPGIAFAVVAVLMIAAVIVYAATSGDGSDDTVAAPTAAPVTTAGTPETTVGPSVGPSPSDSTSPGASPSPSGDPCIVGVWLEERHDEDLTTPDGTVVTVHGGGTFQRYSYDGVAFFDYDNGLRLAGTKGSSRYEFLFTGFISYTYRVENGEIIYSNPRAQGTELLYNDNGHVYTRNLSARNLPPRKLNCGNVAMNLTSAGLNIDLKRTSARQ